MYLFKEKLIAQPHKTHRLHREDRVHFILLASIQCVALRGFQFDAVVNDDYYDHGADKWVGVDA